MIKWAYTLLLGKTELRYVEREDGTALSREDPHFQKVVGDEICHRGDMHHEMPLQFGEENIQVPNSCLQAVQCQHSLKKSLQGDPKYHADYTSFRSEIIDKEYAQKLTLKN